jgi:hypothetical protein
MDYVASVNTSRIVSCITGRKWCRWRQERNKRVMRNVRNDLVREETGGQIPTVKSRKGMAAGERTKGVLLVGRR